MRLIDLNVLLYVVNEDAPHHRTALDWWQSALAGDESLALPWPVVVGFLRIATSPRVFPRPLEPATALQRIDTWLSLENTCLVSETEEHWRTLRGLLEESGTMGNLTSDAHLAALAICHGAVVVSFDSDFGRFRGLRWERPAAPEA